MSHLELELPKRELWGWLFGFFLFPSFPALENTRDLVSRGCDRVCYAGFRKPTPSDLCHHDFAHLEAARRRASVSVWEGASGEFLEGGAESENTSC